MHFGQRFYKFSKPFLAKYRDHYTYCSLSTFSCLHRAITQKASTLVTNGFPFAVFGICSATSECLMARSVCVSCSYLSMH